MTRSASDIGRGLAAARDARPIPDGERIHIVGVAGAGASAAALLAHRAGAVVTGCDAGGPSPYTASLETAGIDLAWQHSEEHLAGDGAHRPQRLAVTKALTAIDPDHPELVAARRIGVPIEAWQQIVADVAAGAGQRLVAVAGTHGKSTTTGWLVDLLMRDGRDPSAFVGALLPAGAMGAEPATARWGGGDLFVVEADEYAGNFDPYRPDVTLLLNAEWDHPDVFVDQQSVEDAFEVWLRGAASAGHTPTLVANVDDAAVARIEQRLDEWPGRVIGFGFDRERGPTIHGRLEARPGQRTKLIVERPGSDPLGLTIGLPGLHNASNALAVVGAAHALGVADEALRACLSEFSGVGRRLELKGDVGGVIVLDDYGHHPTAIARTIEAVRQRYPGRRLWAVYEPLTFHRTAAMLDRFAQVLATADRAVIADIWAGRDPDTTVTSSAALAEAISAVGDTPSLAPGSVEETAAYLASEVRRGDVVLVMGGGRSYVIAQLLVERLAGEGNDDG